jgi:transposase InsO family protein
MAGRQSDQDDLYRARQSVANGFVESFHGRLRDECLNREQLWTLTEARVVTEDYRCQYNHHRPHSKLGYQSPKRFAATTQSAPNQGKQHNQ